MIPAWIRIQDLNDREFFTDVHSKCQERVHQEEKE